MTVNNSLNPVDPQQAALLAQQAQNQMQKESNLEINSILSVTASIDPIDSTSSVNPTTIPYISLVQANQVAQAYQSNNSTTITAALTAVAQNFFPSNPNQQTAFIAEANTKILSSPEYELLTSQEEAEKVQTSAPSNSLDQISSVTQLVDLSTPGIQKILQGLGELPQ